MNPKPLNLEPTLDPVQTWQLHLLVLQGLIQCLPEDPGPLRLHLRDPFRVPLKDPLRVRLRRSSRVPFKGFGSMGFRVEDLRFIGLTVHRASRASGLKALWGFRLIPKCCALCPDRDLVSTGSR